MAMVLEVSRRSRVENRLGVAPTNPMTKGEVLAEVDKILATATVSPVAQDFPEVEVREEVVTHTIS